MPVELPDADGLYSAAEGQQEEGLDVDELAAGLGLGAPGSGHVGGHYPGNNNGDPQQHLDGEDGHRLSEADQALSPADGYFGRSDSGRFASAGASRRPVDDAYLDPNDTPQSDYDTSNYYNDSNHHQQHHTTTSHSTTNNTISSQTTGVCNNNINANINSDSVVVPVPLPTSSQVPHVPDRWVSDPSLDQGTSASDKAREAREEREHQQNRRPFAADRQLNRNLSSTSSADERTDLVSPSSAFSLLNPQPLPQQQPPSVRTTHQHRDIHEDNHKYNNHHDFYSRAGPSTAARVSAGARPSSTPHHQFTPRYPSSSSPSAFNGGSSAAAVLSPTQPITRPHRSATTYSERSSLFSEAPPAYTPSPTSPTSATSTTVNNYQTFSPPPPPSSSSSISSPPNMGRPSESEARGLLTGQTYQAIPESMGGEPDEHDENEFIYPRPTLRERLRRFSFRRQWKMVLLALVLLFLTIGFLVTSITGIKKERTIKTPDESSPVTRPKLPETDADGTRLTYPPYDKDMAWDQGRMCGDKMVTYQPQTFDIDFSASRNLSLFQDIRETTGQPANGKGIKVSGEVVIRRAAPGTPGPAIVLETITNDESVELDLDWDDKEQRLYILTPRMVPWISNTVSPCLQVRATIWAPADSVIDSLNVEGVHLGVKLLDNLSLKLNSFARLASTVGTVVAATDGEKDTRTLMLEAPPASFTLDTRYVEVKTMSSTIGGSWPLCDYLGLETISGSIYAGVRPQAALPDKPRPAILYARSTSGPIEVHEPVTEAVAMFTASQSPTADGMSSTLSAETFVPPRQYGVDLFSMSGTVTGTLAFGYSAKVHTTSGHVTLTLLPVLDQAQAAAPARGSMIETSSTSGTTGITVIDALWTDSTAGIYVPAPVLANTPASANGSLSAAPSPPPPPPVTLPPRDGDDSTSVGARDPYDLLTPPSASSDLASRQQSTLATNPALRVLSARHSATSADLYLTYPRSWEGYFDCDSLSGRIDVGGRDVQILKRENGLPGIKTHVLAGKGDWNSVGAMVKVHTTSGKIGVTVAQ